MNAVQIHEGCAVFSPTFEFQGIQMHPLMKQVEGETTPADAQNSPFHLHYGLLLPFCLQKSILTVFEKDISFLFHLQALRSLRFFFAKD